MEHGASAYRNGRCKCDVCRAGNALLQREQNGKRRAARVLIDGRLVAPLPEEKHGRYTTYKNHGCQCVPCRRAGVAANARFRTVPCGT